jgi:aryl-alcohol dehydrogenase-like predicted oxidoreductase
MGISDKIGLGTVQFGMKYGINNTSGKVGYATAMKIVQYYCKSVTTPVFDTANAYGDSEYVLGKLFSELGIDANDCVISKFSSRIGTCSKLQEAFQKTIENLGVNRLYAFLAHDADSLRENPDVYNELLRLKEEGRIQKIGVSVYFPSQLQRFINYQKPLDLIQIPYNVFDRRFEPFLTEYKNAGIEVHARSAFLQGLFFKEINSLPVYFDPVKHNIAFIQQLANANNLALNKLLLIFCLNQPDIDRVIIGVDSEENLQDNMITEEDICKFQKICGEINIKKPVSDDMILPFKWPTL